VITDDGIAALRVWVGTPARRGGRDELLLRVYASWVADRTVTLGFLREAESRHADQLAVYLARRKRAESWGAADAAGTADFADYATLRRGIGFERGRLAWVRWLIRKLESSD
jgi:hypothetical protein